MDRHRRRAIPFWPSRASSLSSNRSDSRGIQRAGARSPSLSVFRFLFGPIRHPFHFFAAQFVAGGVAHHRFIFFSAHFVASVVAAGPSSQPSF